MKTAPKGVPTVVAWTIRSDGGIAGQVFGSTDFKQGERFETSPIAKGEVENGNVVETASGSRYFLSDMSVKQMKEKVGNSALLPKETVNAPSRPTIQLTQKVKEKDAKKAIEALEKAKSGMSISLSSLFGFGDQNSSSTSPPPKAKKASTPVKIPSMPSPVVSSPTFSLSGLFDSDNSASSTSTPKKSSPPPPSLKKPATPQKKKVVGSSPTVAPPKGVPTIERWKKGIDNSVTGYIKGSNQFQNGERVTTSPIFKGKIQSGEVVVTASGSRYFLK
jgi:hypothetical protein